MTWEEKLNLLTEIAIEVKKASAAIDAVMLEHARVLKAFEDSKFIEGYKREATEAMTAIARLEGVVWAIHNEVDWKKKRLETWGSD